MLEKGVLHIYIGCQMSAADEKVNLPEGRIAIEVAGINAPKESTVATALLMPKDRVSHSP